MLPQSNLATILLAVAFLLSLSTAEEGITFSRTINKIPGSFDLKFDNGHCDSQDAHGDNDCHFEWGLDLTGAYKLVIDVPIEEGDMLEAHFKVGIFFVSSVDLS
jgi:hypothetical protein